LGVVGVSLFAFGFLGLTKLCFGVWGDIFLDYGLVARLGEKGLNC